MKIDATRVSAVPIKSKPVKASAEDMTCGLGSTIRHMRQVKNKTQEEVALAIGLERTSICNIERGNQTLSVQHLQRIADFLGVEMHITFQDKRVVAGGVINPADTAFGLGALQQIVVQEQEKKE